MTRLNALSKSSGVSPASSFLAISTNRLCCSAGVSLRLGAAALRGMLLPIQLFRYAPPSLCLVISHARFGPRIGGKGVESSAIVRAAICRLARFRVSHENWIGAGGDGRRCHGKRQIYSNAAHPRPFRNDLGATWQT